MAPFQMIRGLRAHRCVGPACHGHGTGLLIVRLRRRIGDRGTDREMGPMAGNLRPKRRKGPGVLKDRLGLSPLSLPPPHQHHHPSHESHRANHHHLVNWAAVVQRRGFLSSGESSADIREHRVKRILGFTPEQLYGKRYERDMRHDCSRGQGKKGGMVWH